MGTYSLMQKGQRSTLITFLWKRKNTFKKVPQGIFWNLAAWFSPEEEVCYGIRLCLPAFLLCVFLLPLQYFCPVSLLLFNSQNHKQTAQAADQSKINQCGLKILVVTSTHPEPLTFFSTWHKGIYQLVEPFLRQWRNCLSLFNNFMFKTDWLVHINAIQQNILQIVTRGICVC